MRRHNGNNDNSKPESDMSNSCHSQSKLVIIFFPSRGRARLAGNTIEWRKIGERGKGQAGVKEEEEEEEEEGHAVLPDDSEKDIQNCVQS